MNNIKQNPLFIDKVNDIIENLDTLTGYLNSESIKEREFAENLIKRGHAYVVFKLEDGSFLFGPSMFLGYKKNTMKKYIELKAKKIADGRHTSKTIDGIVKKYTKSLVNGYEISQKYDNLLKNSFTGIQFYNHERKFWIIADIDENFRSKLRYLRKQIRVAEYVRCTKQAEIIIHRRHSYIEDCFCEYLKSKGIEFHQTENNADFIYEDNDAFYIAELKPYTDQNSYKYNIQNAIGQVIRYKSEFEDHHLNKENKPIKMQIVMKGYGASVQRLAKFEKEIEDIGIELLFLDKP